MSKLLLLLTVILMPLGMTPPAAAAPTHHAPMASMPMQHCPEQSPKHTGKAGFVECTMACAAALPASDPSGHTLPVIACTPVQPCLADRLQGLHPETATPPPKRS
jgi:hypothetical protein